MLHKIICSFKANGLVVLEKIYYVSSLSGDLDFLSTLCLGAALKLA